MHSEDGSRLLPLAFGSSSACRSLRRGGEYGDAAQEAVAVASRMVSKVQNGSSLGNPLTETRAEVLAIEFVYFVCRLFDIF